MLNFNFELNQLFYVLRIIVAAMCGIAIGFERLNRSKNAGVRTHCIVAIGAALMMVISKYGFFDTAALETGTRSADGGRIAAQVVSGIGFLGAGMIFVHKNSITGLTTAAGIWATSGVGLAIGAGMYTIGICATVIIIAAQIFLHKKFRWLRTPIYKVLHISRVDEKDYQEKITGELEKMGVEVIEASVEKNTEQDTRNYILSIEIPCHVNEDCILDCIMFDCKIKKAE